MYDKLKNNDLVITHNKKQILKYLSENKKILNLKIMDLSEFKRKYFGYYNEQAIYYLVKKYNYKYEIAKMYLDNYYFNDKLKNELEQNNLIINEPLFKESIKRIVIDNYDIDSYIIDEIKKYDYVYIEYPEKNNNHSVYEFNNINEEINFVILKIIELLKYVNINKIHLVNVGSEYELPLKRLFEIYNIPIYLETKKNIYGTNLVQQFLDNLKECTTFEEALKDLKQGDIYNAIIDIINKYQFKELDNEIKYCIEQELKKKTIINRKLENQIDIVDINEIENNDYYFIIGFNQGELPRLIKDEDYIKDKTKKELGIFTSLELNKLEKEKIKKILLNNQNIYLSYKLKANSEDYYKSPLIDELKLEIRHNDTTNYDNSKLYNKLVLSKKLDNFIKFNKKDNDLSLLYSNYQDIPYLKYDNSYKKIDNNLFNKYINNKLLLSYSSIDNYYRCRFRYYISNILKLNKYEETFMTYIGNLFHYILSIAFKENFDFNKEFDNYILNRTFTNKEQFFINKLKEDLLFTINTIKKQNINTSLNKELYEQKIYVNKNNNLKITFMGIIDKLKYSSFDNKTLVAIIDYKTGTPEININNSVYGIEMQLPIYLYLAQNLELKNIEIAGFYLQKIIHNKLTYKENKEYEKELEKLYYLEGYSNSNIDILKKFDQSYNDSLMVKGMKTSSKGFYQYTKVLDNNQINKLIKIVDNKIDDAITDITDTKFNINPKKIGFNLIGCEYCKFKDICYMKEEDIVNLKEQKYTEFLGGDDNAKVD